MADTVKLPVIGPTDKRWVYIGGAVIAGMVGYAWWTRRSTPAGDVGSGEILPEDVPQDRLPPATVVGEQNFDDANLRSIINTNPEWYTSAVDYLVSTGGYDFTFTSITLGKFLARRQLTEQEAQLVQAAKGAVGEPPQGGPWPILRGTAPGPSTSSNKLTAPVLRVSAGDPRNTNYALGWSKIPGAAYYLVQRFSGPGSPTSIAVIGTYRRTPALSRGGTYGYRVKAVSVTPGMHSSDWSNEVRFTISTRKVA
jgi:hypothetical protein